MFYLIIFLFNLILFYFLLNLSLQSRRSCQYSWSSPDCTVSTTAMSTLMPMFCFNSNFISYFIFLGEVGCTFFCLKCFFILFHFILFYLNLFYLMSDYVILYYFIFSFLVVFGLYLFTIFLVVFHLFNELWHTHKQEIQLQTCVCTSSYFHHLFTNLC